MTTKTDRPTEPGWYLYRRKLDRWRLILLAGKSFYVDGMVHSRLADSGLSGEFLGPLDLDAIAEMYQEKDGER